MISLLAAKKFISSLLEKKAQSKPMVFPLTKRGEEVVKEQALKQQTPAQILATKQRAILPPVDPFKKTKEVIGKVVSDTLPLLPAIKQSVQQKTIQPVSKVIRSIPATVAEQGRILAKGLKPDATKEERRAAIDIGSSMIAVGETGDIARKLIPQLEKSLGKKLLKEETQAVLETLKRFRQEGKALVDITPQGPIFKDVVNAVKTKTAQPVKPLLLNAEKTLVEEAKKYKSAEEFVSKQGQTVYHGTNIKNAEMIKTNPRLLSEKEQQQFPTTVVGDTQIGISTSKDRSISEYFASLQPTGKGEVVDLILPKSVKIYKLPENIDSIDSLGLKELQRIKKAGYDAIEDVKNIGGESEIRVLSPEKLKTKSQLTDIWNNAQTKESFKRPDFLDEVKVSREQAIKDAKAIQKRLKLSNVDNRVMDVIIDTEGGDAFAVQTGNLIHYTGEVPKYTGLHETIHTIHQYVDDIELFTKAGITKEKLDAELKRFAGTDDIKEILAENGELRAEYRDSITPTSWLGRFLFEIKEWFKRVFSKENKSQIGRFLDIVEHGKAKKETFIPDLKEELNITEVDGKRILSFDKREGSALAKSSEPRQLTPEDYKKNLSNIQKSKIKDTSRTLLKDVVAGGGRLFAPISTRLKNINIELKQALRKAEYNIALKTQKDLLKVEPLISTVMKKISPIDRATFDLAAKNGDIKTVEEIAERNGFSKEVAKFRDVLDELYARAKEVDFDIGYRKNYFPRVIKDHKGLVEHFQGTEEWSFIDEAIKAEEAELDRYLTQEEKAGVINKLIRGYSVNKVTLSETAQMKQRQIEVIDADINKFYQETPSAIVAYIKSVNEAIEARRFFGKGDANVEDSIGFYITKLMAERKIKPSQEQELKQILTARFNPKGPGSAIQLYKNISYIDTMGSPISAITQLGDLGLSMYRAGVFQTGKSTVKALLGKSNITVENLGVEKIAQEFVESSTSAKAVNEVFRVVGLNKMDRLGKETFVNSVIDNYRKLAKNPTEDFLSRLEKVFGKETDQVIEDLKSGELTENVKLLAFNELLDIQPIALSEMPEKYLTGGNGRIFYMLKTFQLKQFDVFRNEVFEKMKTDPAEGLKRLLKLGAALIIMNATADEIKDFILGRKTSLKDRTIDNVLKLMGFSKYTIYKARGEGLGAAGASLVLPPFKAIDATYKDLMTFGDEKGSELISSVPIGGKLYYWWFGKGKDKEDRKQMNKKSSGLPELPKLPKLPALPKLPKVSKF